MFGLLFPGQGSQAVGMGRFLFELSSKAKETFEEASDTLGLDMKALCFEGPESDLQLTFNTQPALLTVSIATFRTLQHILPFKVSVAAGHSVGEYAAMVAAEVFSFSKGLELVRLRGQLMQDAVPVGQGGMAAVMGLEDADITKLCEWACQETGRGPLEPANYNCPGQTVISGNLELIQWVAKNFTPDKIQSSQTRVRLIPLKVSAPFHCSMMKPAEREMAGALRDVSFQSPLFDIVQNFTAQRETNTQRLQENLIAQISGPVRWVESIEEINTMGVNHHIESGPGKVLNGLVKKIADHHSVFNFNNLEDIKNFESQLTTIGS